jgi:hypothetical protein
MIRVPELLNGRFQKLELLQGFWFDLSRPSTWLGLRIHGMGSELVADDPGIH